MLRTALLALICAAVLYGCAPKPSLPPPGQRVLPGVSPDTYAALGKQAPRPYSLTAEGRISLRVKGKQQPKVKGLLRFKRTGRGLMLRVSGFGLFGVTVFDAILTEEAFYLFIPSHETVYIAGIRDEVASGRSMAGLAREALFVLSPWAGADIYRSRMIPCPDGLNPEGRDEAACLLVPDDVNAETAAFDPGTLEPVALDSRELSVRYYDAVALDDGTPYPTRMKIRLKEIPLEMDIRLKRVEAGTVFQEGAFDPRPFLKRGMVPLRVLLSSL